jgi:hypothetical protein
MNIAVPYDMNADDKDYIMFLSYVKVQERLPPA